MPTPLVPTLPGTEIPFVGRKSERATLIQALEEATRSKGSAWVLEGPAGMGKTRLAHFAEEKARESGFRTAWGCCLKEVLSPFFALHQIFRAVGSHDGNAVSRLPSTIPSLVVFEEARPGHLLRELSLLAKVRPCLWVTRERPRNQDGPAQLLGPGNRVLQLAKGEGPDQVAPGDLDALAETIVAHLRSRPGSVVALSGFEYLSSQNGFPAALRLVQYVRESAEELGAHLLLSVNPAAFDARQVAILESEGLVVRQDEAVVERDPTEAPAVTMLRFLETLERFASRQPMFLVLDDLQWADPSTLRSLQFLARNIASLPVVLVATLRTEETRGGRDDVADPVEEALRAMERNGSARRLLLQGLEESDLGEIVQGLFGLPLQLGGAGDALAPLFQRSQGNPFFLQETMRQLAAAGYLRREANHLRLDLPVGTEPKDPQGRPLISASLQRLVARRLDALSPAEREVLGWASVVGSEFDAPPLATPLGRSLEEVSEILRTLAEKHHLLEARGSGGQGWSFAHPMVWEVTYAELTSEELKSRAHDLARWWASERPDDVETVARLFRAAGDPREGLPWVRRAIERSLEAQLPEAAERYHEWLQQLLELAGASTAERTDEGLRVAVEMSRTAGLSQSLRRLLEGLLAMGPSGPVRWEIESRRVSCLASMDPRQSTLALSTLEEELRSSGEEIPLGVRVKVILARSVVVSKEGDWPALFRGAEEAAALLGPSGDEWERNRVYFDGSWALVQMGRLQEAEVWLAKLREVVNGPGGSHQMRARCANLMAVVAETAGDLAAQQSSNETCLAESRLAGNLAGAIVALCNLSMVLDSRGAADRSLEMAQEARRLGQRFDLPLQIATAHAHEGMALLHRRRLKEAGSHLSKALELADHAGYHQRDAAWGVYWAETLLWGTGAEECLKELERPVYDRLLSPMERYRPPLLRAWATLALGRHLESKEWLESAARSANEAGDRLSQAQVKVSLSRWEQTHGDAVRSRVLREEAQGLFDRCGVHPDGWIRQWPPEGHRT